MFFGTGWMTDERKPIGKIKMTNNFGENAFFLFFQCRLIVGVAFVVCFLLSIGSMGLVFFIPTCTFKKSTIRVGKNTRVPWILWVFVLLFFVFCLGISMSCVFVFVFVFVVVVVFVFVVVVVFVFVVVVVAVAVNAVVFVVVAVVVSWNLPQEIRLTKAWGVTLRFSLDFAVGEPGRKRSGCQASAAA